MDLRMWLTDCSKGDSLRLYWRLFFLRQRTKQRALRRVLTFLLNRTARRHGGYVGNGAVFDGIPSLPHGLHGVYISRYAAVGRDCRIYQNVTIGEVDGKAPRIGDGCLIGAGAVLVGDIQVGACAKIGAGAVVSQDIPPHHTVVAQPPRILPSGEGHASCLKQAVRSEMEQREQAVRTWFSMWLQKKDLGIQELFAPDAVYVESWGPWYHGAEAIAHWFSEWNTRGSVLRWDIVQFLHQKEQTVVEWAFDNRMDDGRQECFDGLSIIRWTAEGRIAFLQEFGCNRGHYDPYEGGETPRFPVQSPLWF